ncbi:MAG: hypothetical protein JXA20_06385 [Spirochaetes bacterium]|nr:hypothetical protein [Spirochaetota bacterium]
MIRYAGFTILTKCDGCGQPVPLNGPFRAVRCAACRREVVIAPDSLAGLCNDFEEEREELHDGEAYRGTLMGSGYFEYSYQRMEPRCGSCKAPLPMPAPDTDGPLPCPRCGVLHQVYPAPPWLRKRVPSAIQCLSREREASGDTGPGLVDEDSPAPVVMACPKCGGTLTVTTVSERILRCEYCRSDAYVPDAVWTRLHPVKTAEEWFVRFEGKTAAETAAADRRRDEAEELIALKNWRRRRPLRGAKRSLAAYGIVGAVMLAIIVLILMMRFSFGPYAGNEELELLTFRVLIIVSIVGIVMATVVGSLQFQLAYRFGVAARCKKALAALAAQHDWKHEAAEYRYSIGAVDVRYRGRDIKIHPDDDYAIEVGLDSSPFYLKTEPPGYPQESLRRFHTGDTRFDEFFPIRYAEPYCIERIQRDLAFRKAVLESFFWFMDRWDCRIGLMKVDWWGVGAHLAPGHREPKYGARPRYLYPGEIEPLLEDLIALARMIDDIKQGKAPSPPGA